MNYKYGDKVIIYGLNDKRGYDGRVGTVLERDTIHNLWIINVDGVRVGVHEENLSTYNTMVTYITKLIKQKLLMLNAEINNFKYYSNCLDFNDGIDYKTIGELSEDITSINKEIDYAKSVLLVLNKIND